MFHLSDYFVLISVRDQITCHIKRFCFCELFSGTKKSRKLIAGAFSAKGTVIDRIHDDVGGDTVCRLTVSDHKGSIAELTDHTGSTIRSI